MRLQNVEKNIGAFHLKIEDMTLEEGKIHGFVGGNGCGKTTAAKLIMDILQPDAGQIDYEGLSLRDITMTAQRPYLLHDTVYANLVYPLKIRGRKPDDDQIRSMLERFELQDKQKQYARSLSSGEQQKLSMLRALIFQPKCIIVDETFSNMDPESVEKFEELITEKQKTEPITWILISHRLSHIYRMCEKIHFFSQGQVIAEGTGKEVFFGSQDERIRQFVAKEMIRYDGEEFG